MARQDPDIAEQDKRRYRTETMLLLSFVAGAATIAVFAAGAYSHLIPLALAQWFGAIVVAGWVLVAFVSMKKTMPSPPVDPFDETYLRKTIDTQHKRWRYVLSSNLFAVLTVAASLTHILSVGGIPGYFIALFGGVYALVALIAALSVAFGPGFFIPSYRRALGDELVRDHQAKAAKLGFILAVTATSAVLAIYGFVPRYGIASLPAAIAFVIVVPGLYFLVLQGWADRDG